MNRNLTQFIVSLTTSLFLLISLSAESSPEMLATIKAGEYLARTCVSCHTVPGGSKFAGGRPMETPFGILLSPNITPDPQTGIGRWTKKDFYRAVHDGLAPDGSKYFPAFPYPSFTLMPQADIDAIYFYLKSIKPVRNPVHVNQLNFPFRYRFTASIWNEINFEDRDFQPDPTRSQEWNRGAYLVEGPLHCQECHTPRTSLGALDSSQPFAGSFLDHWEIPNISSGPEGIGNWSLAELAQYLKTGVAHGRSAAAGPMAEVVEDSLSHLTDADIKAMVLYLKFSPYSEGKSARNAEKAFMTGQKIYLTQCAGCHHPDGIGRKGFSINLAGNSILAPRYQHNLIKVIREGLPARKSYGTMPAFKLNELSEKQIQSLIYFMRTSWVRKN